MKRSLPLLVFLLMVTSVPSGPAATEASNMPPARPYASGEPDAAFTQLAGAWKDAYNRKDAPGVAALYAEDGTYLSAHVLARGRSEIQAYFQRGMDAGGHVDAIRIVESARGCDLGYAWGTYEATNSGQKVDGRILIGLKKVKGQWLFAAHEVVVRDQP